MHTPVYTSTNPAKPTSLWSRDFLGFLYDVVAAVLGRSESQRREELPSLRRLQHSKARWSGARAGVQRKKDEEAARWMRTGIEHWC